jgi:hypothetical protein
MFKSCSNIKVSSFSQIWSPTFGSRYKRKVSDPTGSGSTTLLYEQRLDIHSDVLTYLKTSFRKQNTVQNYFSLQPLNFWFCEELATLCTPPPPWYEDHMVGTRELSIYRHPTNQQNNEASSSAHAFTLSSFLLYLPLNCNSFMVFFFIAVYFSLYFKFSYHFPFYVFAVSCFLLHFCVLSFQFLIFLPLSPFYHFKSTILLLSSSLLLHFFSSVYFPSPECFSPFSFTFLYLFYISCFIPHFAFLSILNSFLLSFS